MIDIKLADLIEKRLVRYNNGRFYFTSNSEYVTRVSYSENERLIDIKDGTWLEVPRNELILYVQNTFDNLKRLREPDEIFLLNIFDQDIFNIKYWRGTSHRSTISAVSDLVKVQKMGLKFRTKEYPEEIVELIKWNRETYNNNRLDGYLLQLLDEEILDANVLEKSGFFKDLTPDKIKELMSEKLISQKQIFNLEMQGVISRECAIDSFGGLESVTRLYKRAERTKNARNSKLFIQLIGLENGINLYLDGKLTLYDISKLNFDKDYISNLPEEKFVKMLKKGLPEGIVFSSEELIEGYISKLSGNSLLELAEAGVIEPEKLIDLPEIEVDEKNADRKLDLEGLKSLYKPDFIAKKLMEENIDGDFVKKWNEKILMSLDEQHRDEFTKSVISICKKEMSQTQFERMMHSVIQSNILPIEFFKENSVSAIEIEDMYYNEEISEDEIINYYNSNLLGNESIQMLFGLDYDLIIERIKEGKLNIKALSAIPVEELSERIIENKIGLEDVYRVYSEHNKAISAEQLKYIVDEYEADYYLRKELGEDVGEKIRIVNFINNDFDMDMLRELYLADVLSHSDILELKQKGILNEEQSKIISKIDRERLYKKIFEGKIVDAKEIDKPERKPKEPDGDTPERKRTNRERRILRKKSFFKSLGKCDIKPLETQNPKEPFYGYSLIGYPEYGLLILENLASSNNNATYIMTIEEFKSYFKEKGEDKIVITKGKLALKDEIKRGKAIRERYHVRLWGKNVIDTMRELSEEAHEGISADTQIKLSEMMIDEFYREDLESLDSEDQKAKRLIAERDYAKTSVNIDIRKKELAELREKKRRETKKARKEDPNHGEE